MITEQISKIFDYCIENKTCFYESVHISEKIRIALKANNIKEYEIYYKVVSNTFYIHVKLKNKMYVRTAWDIRQEDS